MSTCTRPDCNEQHGLTEGICRLCEFADVLSALTAVDRSRVMRRVQYRVNGGRPLPRNGSAPHDDRVLPIVLVVAGRIERGEDRIRVVAPDSPHWDTFWHDIGRPEKGPERTSEAPESDERVQPVCPTCRGRKFIAEDLGEKHEGDDTFSGYRYDPCPDCTRPYVYRWRDWTGTAQAIADRCNAFWRDRAEPEVVRCRPGGPACPTPFRCMDRPCRLRAEPYEEA